MIALFFATAAAATAKATGRGFRVPAYVAGVLGLLAFLFWYHCIAADNTGYAFNAFLGPESAVHLPAKLFRCRTVCATVWFMHKLHLYAVTIGD